MGFFPSGLPIFGKSTSIDDIAAKEGNVAEQLNKSVTTVIVIEQQGGLKRTLSITGRALPFRPVADSGKQRYKKTLYPGATEATIQVLGPDPSDQSWSGTWSTRYLGDQDHMLYSENGGGSKRVETAEYARWIFDQIRIEGIAVKVTRGKAPFQQVRRGILAEFKPSEQTAMRIDWELRWDWTGENVVGKPPKTAEKWSAKPKDWWDKLNGVLDTLKEIGDEAKGAYKEYVLQSIAKLNTVLQKVQDLMDTAAFLAAAPADTAKQVLILAQNVKQAMWDVQASMIGVMGAYSAVGGMWTATGQSMAWLPWTATQDKDDGAAAQSKASDQASTLDLQIKALLASVRKQSDAAKPFVEPEIKDVYLVKEGDTLRKVSVAYYGTQDHWGDIAEANDLENDDLTAGMTLVIPEVA